MPGSGPRGRCPSGTPGHDDKKQTVSSRIIVLLAVAAIFSALPLHAAERPARWTAFACTDGLAFEARFALGMAQIRIKDGRALVLPRAMSASGARYADDTAEFWNKGRDAMLTIGAEPKRDCRVAD